MELEISPQILEKYPYQISGKSVQWKPKCSTRSDRKDEARKGLMKMEKSCYSTGLSLKLVYGGNYRQIKL